MLPLECFSCHEKFWYDVVNLEARPAGKLITEYGIVCPHCGEWEHSHYENPSLQDKLKALNRVKPGSPGQHKAMKKLMVKYARLQERFHSEANGESRNNDEAGVG